MAADLGVAAAYRELQSDGLIVVKRGLGATVTARTSAQQSAKKSQ